MEGREPRPISPAEVEMIGQAFEQLAEYRIPRESQEADDLAARLSGWAPARESSFAQPLRLAATDWDQFNRNLADFTRVRTSRLRNLMTA
jgi:hypothetical protein